MKDNFAAVLLGDGTNTKIRLHYVEEKPDQPKNLLILLHGFSQYWFIWKPYLEKFSSMGFHVVALDMRGFNESDKPKSRSAYKMKHLMQDVVSLIDHFGYEKAVVMGHDWGGSVVWELAEHQPEKIQAAIIVNSPHRGAYGRNIGRSPFLNLKQSFKSWYIYFFQFPFLPEWIMRFKNFAWLEHNFRSWATRKEAFSDEDIEKYKEALRKPGALTSTINYYRANTFGDFGMGVVKASMGKNIFGKIRVPSLLIWGNQDPPLHKDLTIGIEDFFEAPLYRVHLEEGSHWVLQEFPDRVFEEVRSFLSKYG